MMHKLSIITIILVLISLHIYSPAPVSAVTLPTDYYLIAIGTTVGDTIGNANDLASGGTACTLRDAAGIVTAGTTAGPVNGCDITAIGTPNPVSPVYVINYPANMVYDVDMTFPTPLDEIDIAFNPVYIVGTNPATDIIQADNTAALGLGSRVFNFFQSDSFISDLTLRYGDGRGREGGTLINQAGTLTLENVRIYGTDSAAAGAGLANTSGGTMNIIGGSIIGDQTEPNAIVGTIGTFGGAGILNWNGTMLIENSTVHYNTSAQDRDGGGIYNTFGGQLTIRNSTISNNSLTAVSNADGGGIYNAGTLTIEGGQIHSNTTNSDGGGIYNNFNGQVTISGGTVIGGVGNANTASEGGGIYSLQFTNSTGFVRILDAEISYNTTGRGGGGIFNNGGQLDVGDVTNAAIINNNVAGSINGGGIYNENGTVNITNTTINDNQALGGFGQGGGIYNASITGAAVLTISNSTVNSNDARIGGGIHNAGANAVVILNTTNVTNNTTTNGGGGGIVNAYQAQLYIQNNSIIGGVGNGNTSGFSGAGIFNLGATTTISDSEVSYNIASDGNGGGIYNVVNTTPNPDEPSTMTITNSRITDNQAIFGAVFNPDAGGIYNWASTLTMNNVTLDNNSAADEAGGLLNEDGTVTMTSGTISGNTAATNGGGILNRTRFSFDPLVTSTSLSGVTLLNNTATAGDGGAIHNSVTIFPKTAVVVVDGSRIGDVGNPNTAGGNGGAIYNNSANLESAASVTVSNSFIISNSDGFYHDNATTVVNRSCIEDNGPGFTNNTPASIQNATNNWWGSADGPSDAGGSIATGTGDGVTGGVNFANYNTLGCMVYPPPTATPTAQPVSAFTDFSITKLGFAAQDNRVEWVISVSNIGNAIAQNVVVTDTLMAGQGIDYVDAPNANVTINGQTVTVTLPTLSPGQSYTFSIVTIASDGTTLTNTACVAEHTCATSLVVRELPTTGELPD